MARPSKAWRALAIFWIVVLAGIAGVAGVLAWGGGPGQRQQAIAQEGGGAEVRAAQSSTPPSGPRIAVVVSGMGLAQTDTEAALRALPGAIAIAISAYAIDPAPLVQEARKAGHEVLVSIPMEPAGYPANDEGPEQLLTGASPEANRQRLGQVLGRVSGAVGATGASDGQNGERFAAIGPDLDMLEGTLAAHKLFYIDPRPGEPAPTHDVGRAADVDLDASAEGPQLDRALATLEQRARSQGAALGILGFPHPNAVEQLARWARGLAARNITLVPPSAIVQHPVQEVGASG